jgi:S-adenosylmethionine:tRNA ribosyltransferase-isomerase
MPPQDPRNIEINLFNYELPPSRIAQYPVQERDSSKLLIFKDGNIGQDLFYNLPGFIPENSLMLFNETRVIRARLHFQKETGAIIEIFLLDPVHPTPDIQTAFGQTGTCTWNCLVGNSKRWKHGILRATTTDQDLNIILFAKRKSQEGGSFLIEFSWEPSYLSLATLLEKFGKIPLPPYINRPVNEADNDRYQTVYARNDGSVAAPTAGLHFTDRVLKGLLDRKVNFESVTLHVGAGTFKPVVSKMLGDHEMHFEQLAVSRNTIVSILNNLNHPIGYVGTTTARTI